MPEKFTVDFNWVRKREGFKTHPYVPTCTAKSIINPKGPCFNKPLGSIIGRSGVTIASGFDMGQHSEEDLKIRFRFPEKLIEKMKPFLKKKDLKLNEDPRTILEKNSQIKFDSHELELIDSTAKNYFLNVIAKKYKNDSGKEFNRLDPDIQTSIFSAIYNFGISAINTKGPLNDFWIKIIEDDFLGAANLLTNKKFATERRKLESELLIQGLKRSSKQNLL